MSKDPVLKKHKSRHFIQLIFSVAIAIILLLNLDISALISNVKKTSLSTLGLILVLLSASLLVRGYRWKLLFDNKSLSVRFRDSMVLLFVGLGLNLVLPASSGDVVKSYFGYRWSGVKERMLSISLLDKVIALGSVSFLGIPFAIMLAYPLYIVLGLLVMLPMVLFFLLPHLNSRFSSLSRFLNFSTRLFRGKLDLHQVITEVNIGPLKLTQAIVLSILGWSLTYTQMYLCFRAIHVDPGLAYVFSMAPLLTLVRLFPFTLSGIGSDEAALCFFFSRVGLSMEETISMAIIYRMLTFILPGVFGLVLMSLTTRIRTNQDNVSNGRKLEP
ncbi:MAG: flippase-like domain-containing protein [Sedimentisphaerales bacterium]|nr:flippase-like domain-containing protein [Sedimentisphaerales bacterium]